MLEGAQAGLSWDTILAKRESYRRAREASEKGLFAEEIVPVRIPGKKGETVVDRDEEPFKADLDRYAALHAQAYGEAVDAVTLIPHMLEAFMAGDRGFRKSGGAKAPPPKPS